ncbi:MAG: sulfatase-like hydrolase/transferase [Pseudomonadales bacterium]
MRRYLFPAIFVLLHIAACGNPSAMQGANANKPNILLILIDDMGFNDLAINNGANVPTPVLDSIAAQGIRFTRHYADSTCSPSRAALLTGQYAARNGFSPGARGISSDVFTLPRALREEGYRNYHVGKWHIGHTVRQAWPDQQGFDHWFGFLNQWLLKGDIQGDSFKFAKPSYFNPKLSEDSAPAIQHEGHLTDILTEKAIEYITSDNADKPWFLNLWYYAPHNPVEPAEVYASKFPATDEGRYHAMLSQLDVSIGKVVDKLEETGQADNTLLIIASDNGGTNQLTDNNAPFPGAKSSFQEGGVRTPMLLRWPATLKKAAVVNEIVAIQDVYPTIMNAIAATIPANLDGQSFWPLLAGEPFASRPLFWESIFYQGKSGFSAMSEDGKWRLSNYWPWKLDKKRLYLEAINQQSPGSEATVDNAALTDRLYQQYSRWHNEVHILKLKRDLDDSGHGRLTGSDMQRLPGYGVFSFSVELQQDSTSTSTENLQSETILEQAGLWSITKLGRHITVDIDGEKMEADLPADQACHSLIVSTVFARRNNHWAASKENSSLQLFIDGVLVDSILFNRALADSALDFAPTYIGHSATGEQRFAGRLSNATIYNKQLTEHPPLTVADVAGQACATPI